MIYQQTKRICFLFIFGFFCSLPLLAQQGGSEKGYYLDTAKRYFHRLDLPVYIRIASSPTNEGVLLAGQKITEKKLDVQPIMLDGHGKHILRHNDALDPENTFEYIIYGDGLAPTASARFATPHVYVGKGGRAYGRDLKVALQAQDEMSGVETLFFRLDSLGFAPYTGEFGVATEGPHQVQYYGIDHVGNKAPVKTETFTVDVTPPTSTYNIVGVAENNVISVSTKIYFTATDNIVGVAKTSYKFDDAATWSTASNGAVLPTQQLAEGPHTLTYYSTDHLDNAESPRTYSFFLDKTAPIMSADALGDKYIVGNQVYFSGRTKLKLTAVDNKAGVKKTFYSIDGGPYQVYDQPFYMPDRSGNHIIRYYGEDNMGNEGVQGADNPRYQEYKHNVSAVYVDLTGPQLSFAFEGKSFKKGDKAFIGPTTSIKLTAVDKEAGLQRIAYAYGDVTTETPYTTPLSLTSQATYDLHIIGYDNVNNRNVIRTSFVVDTTPPNIFNHFSTAPANGEGYPSYAKLFLAAEDDQTDCQAIYYSVNGEPKKEYRGSVGGFKKDSEYRVMVEVEDRLGNRAQKEIAFKTLTY
jgi:hypothetical protein